MRESLTEVYSFQSRYPRQDVDSTASHSPSCLIRPRGRVPTAVAVDGSMTSMIRSSDSSASAEESERLLTNGARRGTSSSSSAGGAATPSTDGAQQHRSASKIAAGWRHKRRSRRVEMAMVMIALACVGGAGSYVWAHGLPDLGSISPAQVYDAMDKAGALGVLLWAMGFCLAELCHLPAMVFIITGVLRWGHFLGFALASIMAPLSCAVSFVVVRRIGGQALTNVQWRFVQRMMTRLERKPVVTVVILRTFLFLSPSLNYALALSNVSFKNFMIGSTIGLVAPMSMVVLGIDHLIKFYGWSRADVVATAVVTAAAR